MVVLLIGPPGCGKGTQSARLKQWLGIPGISTGDMFRYEIEKGTPLGVEAAKVINKGQLVDDGLVGKMLMARLSTPECASGYLLDGYPRTVSQAKFLSEFLAKTGRPEPLVLHIEVPADLLIRRMSARRSCPSCGRIYNLVNSPPKIDGLCDDDQEMLTQREDDRQGVIKERLDAYQEWTEPVVEYYEKAAYFKIDGNRSPQEVFTTIENCVQKYQITQSKSLAPLQ